MGLDLCINRIKDGKRKQAFDLGGRLSDEKHFAAAAGSAFEVVYLEPIPYDDMPEYRPKDFDKAREWVRQHVEAEGNKESFLKMLDVMEADPDIWIYVSV